MPGTELTNSSRTRSRRSRRLLRFWTETEIQTDQAIAILPAERLHALICASLSAMGGPQGDAATVADHLVLSDQSGHPSHGTGMMAPYVQSFRSGALDPERRPSAGNASAPVHVVDADHALGHVVMMDAVREGAAIARGFGVAVVNVARAHHIGRVAP